MQKKLICSGKPFANRSFQEMSPDEKRESCALSYLRKESLTLLASQIIENFPKNLTQLEKTEKWVTI